VCVRMCVCMGGRRRGRARLPTPCAHVYVHGGGGRRRRGRARLPTPCDPWPLPLLSRYAATRAAQVWLFEPDQPAFVELRANFKLNPDLDAKSHLSTLCIDPGLSEQVHTGPAHGWWGGGMRGGGMRGGWHEGGGMRGGVGLG
jgi:hypothetical protein